MGKNSSMDCKSIIKLKKIFLSSSVFYIFKTILFFLIVNILFSSSLVFADDLIRSSRSIRFNSENLSYEVGTIDGKSLKWQVGSTLGSPNSLAFDVYDSTGNIIDTGSGGEISSSVSLPIIFKTKCTTAGNDWTVFLDLEFIDNSTDTGNGGPTSNNGLLNNIIGGIDDLKKSLLDVLKKLLNVLTSIDLKLNDLLDYLTNDQHLKDSIDNLKDSIDNMNNKFTPSDNVVNNVTSLGQGGTTPIDDIEVEFAPGVKFKIFDLSNFAKEINMIRELMSAIIWIEFIIFTIRIVVPKFKV